MHVFPIVNFTAYLQANASLASIPFARCNLCEVLFFFLSFFFLFFLHVLSHAYISERAFQPDRRKTVTIRISVGARARAPAYAVEIAACAFAFFRRGNDISCCIRLNCKTIGGGKEITADYRRLLSAPCRLLIAVGRIDRNRLGL